MDVFELQVAIPTPTNRLYSYKSYEPVEHGTRVEVSFARRKVAGVVLDCQKTSKEELDSRSYKTLSIQKQIDANPIYSETMIKLAHWLSDYYMHPIGEVLRTMMPAGSKKTKKVVWQIADSLTEAENLGLDFEADLVKGFFGKRTQLTDATLKKKLKATDLSLESLKKRKLIKPIESKGIEVRSVESSNQVHPEQLLSDGARKKKITLTSEQQKAVDEICKGFENEKDASNKPILLHGVTGSGKTEVFLHCIDDLLEKNQSAQVLVLVPEISLTPQMTMIFESRFPSKVTVVHSNMDDKERWARLQSVHQGDAQILIGPRSSVFAPFKNLKFLIVDEEHDSSYKQGSGLLYNGRDVAVVRAKLENATLLLGSATPSLESYVNADKGKYKILQLKKRATGAELPLVEAVASKAAQKFINFLHDDSLKSPFADSVVEAIRENAAKGNQALVLVNRRGTAYYLLDVENREPVQCPSCSISMTLHKRATLLHCHYCGYQTSVKDHLSDKAKDGQFVAIGYGSERATETLKMALPELRIERLDSDIAAKRGALLKLLEDFRQGKIDVLVGTQILAKGHDFAKVQLIALLEIDQMLNLPDFRSAERTFQLLVQAAGRAGRAGGERGRVLMQSSREDHPIVNAGLTHDYESYLEEELPFRRMHAYPPYARMILIEYNSEDYTALLKLDDKVNIWLNSKVVGSPELYKKVRILGPSVPAIETIRKRHRRMMMWSSVDVKSLRTGVREFLGHFSKLPSSIRMKVDVDPQSIL